MPGIEQNMDFSPILSQAQGAAAAGLQNAANAAGPLTIHANVVVDNMGAPGGLAPAAPVPGYSDPTSGQTPAQSSAMSQAWQFSAVNPPMGSYPNPMGTQDIYRNARANELWEGIQHQGFLYSLREMQGGQFDPWMGHLTGGAKTQADEVARAARRKEGHQIAGASEEMGAAGQKIYQLMQTIEAAGHGTPAAAKAAEEVAKLLNVIDRLAESAGKAADSIGGSAGAAAKAELNARAEIAKGGMEAPGVPLPGGGQWTASELQMMTTDPIGFAKLAGTKKLFTTLAAMTAAPTIFGEGGALAAGGALGGAGILAAGGAALYAGFQLPEWFADFMIDGADKDAAGRLQDYRLSNMIGGRKGDLRGALYDSSRVRFNDSAKAEGINFDNVRKAIQSIGVSFEGSHAFGDEFSFYRDLDKRVARRNAEFGLADGSMEGFIGQEMRSGGLKRDDFREGVDRLAGYLESANKIGVSSNEKLSTLASLNQAIVGKMGYLASDTEHYMAGFQSFLENTEIAALRGQQGVKVMGENTENFSMEAQAGLYSDLMSMGDAEFKSTLRKATGSDKAFNAAWKGAKGDRATLALALLQDPSQRLAYRQRMAAGPLGGLDPITSSLYFGAPITLQELMFNDVLPGATPGAVRGLDAANTKAGAPRQFNTGVQAANAKEQEANESNQILAMMGMGKEIADNTKTSAQILAAINLKLDQRGAKTDIKGEFFRALGTHGNTITTNGILNADNISSMK